MTTAYRAEGESPASYSAASKWLHWIMAILIIGMIPAGIALTKLPDGPTNTRASTSLQGVIPRSDRRV